MDEWLATGCGGDGTESPAERTLSRTAKAAYFEGNSFRVMFDLDLNPSIQAPAEPPELIGAGATFTGIYEGAKTRASYLFVVFLASEWKYRLYRCPTCGRYKLLNKAPRSQYKGRIFCRKHQQAQAARRITQEKRERAKEFRARGIKSVSPGPQVFVTQVSVARADPDSASTHPEVEPDRRPISWSKNLIRSSLATPRTVRFKQEGSVSVAMYP